MQPQRNREVAALVTDSLTCTSMLPRLLTREATRQHLWNFSSEYQQLKLANKDTTRVECNMEYGEYFDAQGIFGEHNAIKPTQTTRS